MTVEGLGRCQVDGCHQTALYGLFKTQPDGKKEWLNVCSLHERIIGDENIARTGNIKKKEVGSGASKTAH